MLFVRVQRVCIFIFSFFCLTDVVVVLPTLLLRQLQMNGAALENASSFFCVLSLLCSSLLRLTLTVRDEVQVGQNKLSHFLFVCI